MIYQARIQTTATFALAKLEKSGKRCEKSGKYWIKSEEEILRRFIFFPVSAPVYYLLYEKMYKEAYGISGD